MAFPTDYGYYKEITIQDANIDGDLSDFPVLIKWASDGDIDTTKCQADLDDIRFYDGSGNLLKYEVDDYTIDGTDSSAEVWVKKPNVYASPAGDDNKVRIYYGKAAAANGEDAANVWDANYKCVLHLGEASGTLYDSTSNNNDFTAHTTPPVYGATGQVGKSITFNGSSQYLQRSAAVISGPPATFNVLFKPDNVTTNDNLTWCGNSAKADEYLEMFLRGYSAGDYIKARARDGSYYDASTTAGYVASQWQMATAVFASTSSRTVYLDGGNKGTQSSTVSPNNFNRTSFACARDSSPGAFFHGSLDEIRVSDCVRSDAWIKFVHANIFNNDNEQTWGAEQAVGNGASAGRPVQRRSIFDRSPRPAMVW